MGLGARGSGLARKPKGGRRSSEEREATGQGKARKLELCCALANRGGRTMLASPFGPWLRPQR